MFIEGHHAGDLPLDDTPPRTGSRGGGCCSAPTRPIRPSRQRAWLVRVVDVAGHELMTLFNGDDLTQPRLGTRRRRLPFELDLDTMLRCAATSCRPLPVGHPSGPVRHRPERRPRGSPSTVERDRADDGSVAYLFSLPDVIRPGADGPRSRTVQPVRAQEAAGPGCDWAPTPARRPRGPPGRGRPGLGHGLDRAGWHWEWRRCLDRHRVGPARRSRLHPRRRHLAARRRLPARRRRDRPPRLRRRSRRRRSGSATASSVWSPRRRHDLRGDLPARQRRAGATSRPARSRRSCAGRPAFAAVDATRCRHGRRGSGDRPSRSGSWPRSVPRADLSARSVPRTTPRRPSACPGCSGPAPRSAGPEAG